MGLAAFDTLSVADKLQNEYDVPEKQARGIASVMNESFVGNVATKEDLAQTEQKLTGEIEDVRKDMRHMEEKLSGEIAHVEEKLSGQITHVEEKLTGEIKWIKLIGGAILAVLILPWLAELAKGVLP